MKRTENLKRTLNYCFHS